MTDQYKCPSWYDDNNTLRDCVCGKCEQQEPYWKEETPEEMLARVLSGGNYTLRMDGVLVTDNKKKRLLTLEPNPDHYVSKAELEAKLAEAEKRIVDYKQMERRLTDILQTDPDFDFVVRQETVDRIMRLFVVSHLTSTKEKDKNASINS